MNKKNSKDKYTGSKKNNKPHGIGICKYENGDIYEGEWKNGKHNGFGIFVGSDGCRYMGQFKNGKKHGYGTIYCSNDSIPDATVISGQWENREAEGIAVVFCEKNKSYAGQVSKTHLTGIGINISEEGISAGQNGVEHGNSFMLLFRNDGTTGLSIKMNGKHHGDQINFNPDGSRLVTRFNNGIRERISYIEMPDGTMIIGEMDDSGILDGEVSLIYPDGKKFKRSFVKGKELGDWESCEY